VASGDPTPEGVVLWTRLMSDVQRDQSWQREAIQVEWEVGTEENFGRIVRRGRELAVPEFGHSVHVDVNELQPNRWYWYRFKCGSASSPIGRTKTAPSGPADRIRFAFASCQNYQNGYYTAYQNMVREDLDVVVFLGDYIYEGAGTAARSVTAPEPVDLEGYRGRYAQYRSDPHLQEAHRLFPWIITWDDHEVDNNYANDIAEDGQARDEFLKRRTAAYQAHYEWLPMQKACIPEGPNARIYRRLSFGPLARFLVLDGRQYRSDQPCDDGIKAPCTGFLDGPRTMLGAEQEKWLDSELRASKAQWNIVANQVQMTVVDRSPGPGELYGMDTWSGYETARHRMVSALRDSKVLNPIVITGDIHSNWVGDLKVDYRDKRSPVVATELIGTSISTGGDGGVPPADVAAYLPENPHIRFYNNQRGYVRCTLTKRSLIADFRVVQKVTAPESSISTRASFVVEDGQPEAKLLSS